MSYSEGILEDELVDTRGGWTWKMVRFEEEDGKYTFYVWYYGYNAEPEEVIDDPEDIKEYLAMVTS